MRACSVDVLIIGAGPGGATAAIYGAQNHPELRFAIVEKREDMFRPQVLNGMKDVETLLLSCWVAIEDKIKIKALERKLRARIFHLHSKTDSNLDVFIPFELIAINPKTRVATLCNSSDPRQIKHIQFKHLVSADGAHRLSWSMLGKPAKSTHHKLKTQPHYREVGLITLRSRSEKTPPEFFFHGGTDATQLSRHLKQLETLPDPKTGAAIVAWQRPYFPACYGLLYGADNRKINLGCEIPSCISQEKDPEKKHALLVIWGQRISSILLNLYFQTSASESKSDDLADCLTPDDFIAPPPSKKHDPVKKHHLQATTTLIELDQAKAASFALTTKESENKHSVIGLGDVLSKPFFPLASGALNAIYAAEYAIDCLASNGDFDGESYRKKIELLYEINNREAKKIIAEESDIRFKQTQHYIEDVLAKSAHKHDEVKHHTGMSLLTVISEINDIKSAAEKADRRLCNQIIKALTHILYDIRPGIKYLATFRSALPYCHDIILSKINSRAIQTQLQDAFACLTALVQSATDAHAELTPPSPPPIAVVKTPHSEKKFDSDDAATKTRRLTFKHMFNGSLRHSPVLSPHPDMEEKSADKPGIPVAAIATRPATP